MWRTFKKFSVYKKRIFLAVVLFGFSLGTTAAVIHLLAVDDGLTSRTYDLEENVSPVTQQEDLLAGLNTVDDSPSETVPNEQETPVTQSQTSSTKSTVKEEDASSESQNSEENKKIVYLTFDDGPVKAVTPALLEMLSDHDVEGTFFVRGDRVEINPKLAKRIVREGHQIANHTFSHGDLMKLEDPLADLRKTDKAIEKATGVSPTCYRPPYGSMAEPLRSELADAGLKEWRWNFDTFDWRPDVTEDDIRKKLALIGTSDGPSGKAIVLMHDQGKDSLKAVRALDSWLEVNKNNFDFRILPEC